MNPSRSTELAIQFALGLSPWWLLLLVPLVAAFGWRMYRVQFKGVSRLSKNALLAMRIFLLAALAVLLFRPSLIHRTTLKYPGRVFVVVDDSMSMQTKDSTLADDEALLIARRLEGAGAEQSESFFQISETLANVVIALRRFQTATQGLDRKNEAFWDTAGAAQEKVRALFDALEKSAASAPALEDESAKKNWAALQMRLKTVRSVVEGLFSTENSGSRAIATACEDLDALTREALAVQSAADKAAIAKGNTALTAKAQSVRGSTRLELLGRQLKKLQPRAKELAPTQQLSFVRLMNGQPVDAQSFKPDDLKCVAGTTDIVGCVSKLIEDPDGAAETGPIASVVLCTDGRDTTGRPVAALQQALASKQIPVFSAGVGALQEPFDLALLKTMAPPFAVKNVPVRVRAEVKARRKEAGAVGVQLLAGATALGADKAALGERDVERAELRYAPAKTGLFRHRLQFESSADEAFPVENNGADLAMQVRDEKVKVLLLDWKPRWETRFFLNILQRLDYIELNGIVVVTQPKGTLTRGVQKGAWPENLAALEMYDLVILGDLPDDLLTDAEWNDLKTLVEEKGKTVCFLAPKSAPRASGVADALLPAKLDAYGLELDQPAQLRLTPSGRFHPLTARMAEQIEVAAEKASSARADAQVQLTTAESAPVIACRNAGRGKTVLIGNEMLWKALNPSLLKAHGEMVIELVTWAVQGGLSAEQPQSALALDRRVMKQSDALQVWMPANAAAELEILADGERVATARPAAPREGASISRAVFENLPAKDLTLRVKDKPETAIGPIVALTDDPELKYLARDEGFLKNISSATGGACGDFTELEKFFAQMQPKEKVEKLERVWRLWDSGWVLALVVIVLTAEWVWRKWIGLV